MTFKSTLHADHPSAGEVWISNAGNYYRIDQVEGRQVSVTRLGYAFEGEDYVSRKKHGDSHVFLADCFTVGNNPMRRIARTSGKFEQFLSTHAVNRV